MENTRIDVIPDVLDDAALRHADRIAVQDARGALTFTDLRDRARRLAAGLLERGLEPGDRVLEALPNGTDLLVCELALAIAGLVRIPLNPRLGQREWHGIQVDSGARGLVLDARLHDADGRTIAARLDAEITVRVDLGDLDALIDGGDAHAVFPAASPDDLVGLAYSSGTTGTPKGAQRTHRMRLASMRGMMQEVIAPTGAVTAYLHAGPAIHTSGLFILPMLTIGARQVMADHPTPADIADLVASEGITHLALVPSVIDALTHLPEDARHAFADLKMMAYAGSPMPPAHVRRAARLLTGNLVQYYGLVEAMPPLTVLGIDDHARALKSEPGLLASAGRVVPEAELRIVRTQPDDESGEIAVRGPMVTPGYWNATKREDLGKAFTGDSLLTGDIGRLEHGYLFLTDRRKNMLISGGYNVYPGEIEAAVDGTPGLREAVAVGLPDERWGQRIVLAYTTLTGAALEPSHAEELDARLLGLTRHKRPKSLHRLDQFPLGATGKIDRRKVVALLTSDAPSAIPERTVS